jgi:hypothetical protein
MDCLCITVWHFGHWLLSSNLCIFPSPSDITLNLQLSRAVALLTGLPLIPQIAAIIIITNANLIDCLALAIALKALI